MAKRLGGLVILAAGACGLAAMLGSGPTLPPTPEMAASQPRPSAEACARVAPRDYAALARHPAATLRSPATRRAQGSPAVSVRDFDILGVRLGMDKEDVLLALGCADAVTAPADVSATSCASDTIANEQQWKASHDSFRNGQHGWLPPEAGRSCTKEVRVNAGDDLNLIVEFAEDLPARPGRSVATRVILYQGGRNNSASIKAFTDALARKYGPSASSGSENGWWGGEPYGTPRLSTAGFYGRFKVELEDTNEVKRLEAARSLAVSDARPVAAPRL